tara:strand:+ start:283 stop:660 length:378 start_codon:yes stop_codon:yes gene_type:complete
MIKQCISATAFSLLLAMPSLHADELADAAQALCEKVKSCAMAQMEGQELTPETRQMMQPMLDSMCTQVRSRVGEVPSSHALYQPAVACMQSMNSMTCENMQDAGEMVTPECDEYEQLVNESGAAN